MKKDYSFILKLLATGIIVLSGYISIDKINWIYEKHSSICSLVFVFILFILLYIDYKLFILSILCIAVIYWYTDIFKAKESYMNLSKPQRNNFINVQVSNSPHHIYDLNAIEKYINEDEYNYFMENQRWNWSSDTQQRYKDAINKNNFIRIPWEQSIDHYQKIYSDYAINYILDYQDKIQYQYDHPPNKPKLPSGVGDFPFTSGLIPTS